MSLAGEIATSFALGLATPLSAVCVVPLYPGFLAFLSNQGEIAPSVATLSAIVAAGVIAFMSGVGVVFTTLLQESLTGVVEAVSPVAFGLLAVLGLGLIADLHPWSRVPTVDPPQTRYPSASAFVYGGFFGAIVLPCNPGFISVFFARSFLFSDPLTSVANFGAFGVGMAAPLLGFGIVSEPWRDRVLGSMTRHRRGVNVATGGVLLAVSAYYLIVVFEVFGSVG